MKYDKRESYENENLEESKLNNWYGVTSDVSLGMGFVLTIVIIGI